MAHETLPGPARDALRAQRIPSTAVPTLRVLIADDNEDAAESLALLLRAEGHQVTVVHDGDEAIERAAADAPQIVLLDIGMPRVDGLEAARRIRATPRGRNLYLVALTGWGEDKDRERTHAAGFDAHLVKPLRFNELRETFRNAAQAAARTLAP